MSRVIAGRRLRERRTGGKSGLQLVVNSQEPATEGQRAW